MPKKLVNAEKKNNNIEHYQNIDDDFTSSEDSVVYKFDDNEAKTGENVISSVKKPAKQLKKNIEDTPNEFVENVDDAKVVKKRGRPFKSLETSYVQEKELLLLKMNSILAINSDELLLCTDGLNDDLNPKKQEILNYLHMIKKYFSINRWSYFVKKSDNIVILIKNFYIACGYDVKQIKIQGKNVSNNLLLKKHKNAEKTC
jgi:serine/threonine protein phosphatase PrpC